jgi:hypothetical protein
MEIHGDFERQEPRHPGGPVILNIGTVIFAAPDTQDYLQQAKEWIHAQRHSADDVRLGRQNGQIIVVTRRELMF